MKNALVTITLLVSVSVQALADAPARDRQEDVAVLTEKKIVVWPELYADRVVSPPALLKRLVNKRTKPISHV